MRFISSQNRLGNRITRTSGHGSPSAIPGGWPSPGSATITRCRATTPRRPAITTRGTSTSPRPPPASAAPIDQRGLQGDEGDTGALPCRHDLHGRHDLPGDAHRPAAGRLLHDRHRHDRGPGGRLFRHPPGRRGLAPGLPAPDRRHQLPEGTADQEQVGWRRPPG